MKYSPPLDGLRAVAILAVLAFHVLLLRGGFVGVDVFFVLSGYLITSVILHDIRNGKFSMREFYLRRIQRLLPNAATMILSTALLSLLFLLPSIAVKTAAHGLWALFNLSNIYIWSHFGGYWGDSATSAPLLHTWSLAIEEQFYLLFPSLLWLSSRRTKLFPLTSALTLVSFALSLYGTWAHTSATFYFLPTRAWEPLLGAMLAAYRIPIDANEPLRSITSVVATEIAGWGGLLLILAGCLFITEANHFPGVVALLPTLGTLAVLVSVADGAGTPARLLSAPLAVWIGKLSYSLYLWHWPLIVILRTDAELLGKSPQFGEYLGLLASIPIAILTYYLIEHPLRRRGPGSRQRLAVLASVFSVCFLTCFTASLRHPRADAAVRFDQPQFSGFLYDVADFTPPTNEIRYFDMLFPQVLRRSEAWKSGGIVHNWGNGSPRIVVLGSSHALMYAKVIDGICKQQRISVAFLSANATPVFFPTTVGLAFRTPSLAQDFDAARAKWISQWNPDAVLVIERWDNYARDPVAFRQQLRALVAELTPHTPNIILFSQVPALRISYTVNVREFVSWYAKLFGRLPEIPPNVNEAVRKSSINTLGELAHEFPKVNFVRVDQPFYTSDGSVRYYSGRKFYYMDDNHLTDAGAEVVHDIFAQAIAAAHVASVSNPH